MKFSTDYPKLDWKVFTTIRQNRGYYIPGEIIKINTPTKNFKAEVLAIQPIKKQDITFNMAKVDANTTAEGLTKQLIAWYGPEYNDYILITLAKCENVHAL